MRIYRSRVKHTENSHVFIHNIILDIQSKVKELTEDNAKLHTARFIQDLEHLSLVAGCLATTMKTHKLE